MPALRITPREFQLVLLRRMADYHPELVEQARRVLGATVSEQREVNAHWQRMQRSRSYRGALPALRGFLGEPLAQEQRRIGDLTCHITRWKLPLWPDLLFEALTGPGGVMLTEQLVRDPAAAKPRLETIDDLTPWSCVIGDVERAFASVRHRDGSAPSRWTMDFTAPDGAGTPVAVTAEFVWGLLQTARTAAGSEPR
ncbi:hypothetical protein KGA66_11990 [Actinocrinis puniceicyclus]|uniref:Uncharacterized protein n=1 Tax=Actinocrinis puniceicyclus TaxID=977794 RepID=A0A8J8BEI1_9ACTN|nr:hypothetical protein [Actinocrinis puniceicyclus]MBS2963774.1 hypothetical protein [Actinocrinis puniceicyclus]